MGGLSKAAEAFREETGGIESCDKTDAMMLEIEEDLDSGKVGGVERVMTCLDGLKTGVLDEDLRLVKMLHLLEIRSTKFKSFNKFSEAVARSVAVLFGKVDEDKGRFFESLKETEEKRKMSEKRRREKNSLLGKRGDLEGSEEGQIEDLQRDKVGESWRKSEINLESNMEQGGIQEIEKCNFNLKRDRFENQKT